MTDTLKLTMLRAISGVSTEVLDNSALEAYLTIAGDIILHKCYPFLKDYTDITVPGRYETLQVQMANELIQKRGAEGETSHSENGVNRAYETAGISEALMSQIVPYAHVPGASETYA